MNQVNRTLQSEGNSRKFRHTRFELLLLIMAAILSGTIFGTILGFALSVELQMRPAVQAK